MLSFKLLTTKPRMRGVLLAFLLGIALLGPLSTYAMSVPWLPSWSGAAVSVTALLGLLCVFWRTGALRGVLLVSFLVALALAASSGFLR
jgi:hypothetical protein